MIEDEVLLARGRRSEPRPPLVWIPAGLHERPEDLRSYLQDLIDRVDDGALAGRSVSLPSVRPGRGSAGGRGEAVTLEPVEDVLLALGYCGNGLLGLASRRVRLAFPRVDDCISLFLNRGCTREEICRDARAFYFTKGWLCHDNPMLESFDEWVRRFGPERARRLRKVTMGAYERITLIDTGAFDVAEARRETESLAGELDLDHTLVDGSIQLLERLFAGPWDSEIVALPVGEPITVTHLFGPDGC
ncbi:MAG: DUF1638 domain-containing protein [Deltaproteobacteria bacterium]|nr:DUF1638 domain-containing protein [Deltaproteobacteria bacterium]